MSEYIAAAELRTGDALHGRNGHGGTSLTVTGVYPDGEKITVSTRLGDRTYYADETVEVSR